MNKQAIITENNVDWLITYDKDGYEKKRYCLSLDPSVFTPKFPGEICPEYMLRYCQAKGLADLEWYVNTLEELVEKVEENKITHEVIRTVKRKRTPSEVKQAFIEKYFPNTVKRVKDVAYQGHASKAKQLLEAMKATQEVKPAKKPATDK
jgi:hypothetical protein